MVNSQKNLIPFNCFSEYILYNFNHVNRLVFEAPNATKVQHQEKYHQSSQTPIMENNTNTNVHLEQLAFE